MTQDITNKKEQNEVKCSDGNSSKFKDRKDKNVMRSTKVVVRRLPPSTTKEQFIEQISPIPEHDYIDFVAADYSLGQHACCVAYLNFIHDEDIFVFKDKFDGYVFLDVKGNEYPAVVEFAPFQKIPKRKNRKDLKCGTIEQDPDYIQFLELLKSPAEISLPSIDSNIEEIENKEKELKANKGVLKVKTPLLEYVKQRKQDRIRIREERRDERRRKEIERRKQRDEERRRRKIEREKQMKDKQSVDKKYAENDEKTEHSDVDAIVKVLKNPERKQDDHQITVRSDKQTQQSKSGNIKSEEQTSNNFKDKEAKKKVDKNLNKDGDKNKKKSEQVRRRDVKESNRASDTRDETRTSERRKFTNRVRSPERRKVTSKESQYDDETNSKDDDHEMKTSKVKSVKDTSRGGDDLKKVKPDQKNTEIMYSEKNVDDHDSSKNVDDHDSSKNDSCSLDADTNDDKSENERMKAEKRIRNKDRPAMALYRPGMRRMTGQKTSNSGTQKETSSSKSPSPTNRDKSVKTDSSSDV